MEPQVIDQPQTSDTPANEDNVGVTTTIFSTLEEAKGNAEAQNANLPETNGDGKRVLRANVFVARAAGRDPLYVVAVAAGRARDAAAQHWGVIVELAEPKRKPKPTLVELLAATGSALSPEQVEKMRELLDKIAPPKAKKRN